jgi:hypothetical protein
MSWFQFSDDHEKLSSIAIVGLLLVAVVAMLFAMLSTKCFGYNNATNVTAAAASSAASAVPALIALAATAIGAVAGFITHKVSDQTNGTNGTSDPILDSPNVPSVYVQGKVNIPLNASSPNSYKLTYLMDMQPDPDPDGKASIDPHTGAFSWCPTVNDENKSFNVTFVVTDDHGGSASKIINLKVNPKTIS